MTLATATDTATTTGESVASMALGIGVIAALIGCVVLFIAGVVSALRSGNYASGGKAIWILAMLSFPFLGPLVWFIWGRKSTFGAPPATTA